MHVKYLHSTAFSKYYWYIKNKLGVNPLLKWEDVKRAWNYKAGDKFCVEKKLVIATYSNLKELLNQRLEIFNECRHKNKWLLKN